MNFLNFSIINCINNCYFVLTNNKIIKLQSSISTTKELNNRFSTNRGRMICKANPMTQQHYELSACDDAFQNTKSCTVKIFIIRIHLLR